MSDAVNALGQIHCPPGRRPQVDAVADRGNGLPTGTPWANAIGVGRQCGCPRRRQGLAYARLPRPFVWGGHPPRARLRAATCGHPRASPRGRLVIELELAREWPSLGRSQRLHRIDARGMFPARVWGHPTHGSQPCRPGRAAQVWARVYGADSTTWRGAVPSLVEAEDLALDLLPGAVWPGRHQGLASLCCGSWPLTHHGPLQGTGPTSA